MEFVWRRAVLAAFLVAWPHAVGAQQPTPEEAEQAAVQGMELCDGGRYAEALPLIEKGLTYDPHPTGLYYKAVCLYELDQRLDEALATLRGVRESADLAPEAAAGVPALIAKIETRLRRGTLTVELTGAAAGAAKVFVDDRPVDGELGGIVLDPGPHTVRAEGPGCPAAPERLELAPRGAAAVRLRCEPGPARLAIETTEGGMAISIDGEPRGASPLPDAIELPAGAYTVRLEKDGFVPIQRQVELAPGDFVTLELEPIVAESQGGSSVWAWSTLGAGVALVGVGAGFFGHYGVRYAEAQDPPPDREPGTVENTDLIIGGVATGVGAALVVTSFFLWPDEPASATAAIGPTVAPLPGGAALGWSGTY